MRHPVSTPARPPAAPRWRAGWWSGARRIDSPNHGPRPQGVRVDLAVVHSISLPPGEYGGGGIEALFLNRLDASAHPYFAALAGLEVSAHFVIRRDATLLQFVSVERRAWHAGRSQWRGRDNCNDHSVGIELEGLEGQTFEPGQYDRLAELLSALSRAWPVREIVGHEHVAPGRKQDPGAGFDWPRLQAALSARQARATVADEVLAGCGAGPATAAGTGENAAADAAPKQAPVRPI